MISSLVLAAVASSLPLNPQVCSASWTNAQVAAIGATTAGDVTLSGAACSGGLLLPARAEVQSALIVITGQAAGPTTVTVSLGRTGASYIDYVKAADAKAAAQTWYGDAEAEMGTNLAAGLEDFPSPSTTTQLVLHFISTGANLSTVTGSTGTVVLKFVQYPAITEDNTNLIITSPKPHAGVYRRGSAITVSGTNTGAACTIEASIAGGAFSTVQANVTGAFSGTITAPSTCVDRADVLVRCSNATVTPRRIPNVSVGIRAGTWGQSNASGFGAADQLFDAAASGFKRGYMTTNCGERGNITDPFDRSCSGDDTATRDTAGATGAKGSVWPLVAARFIAVTGCPIELVAGGTLGGTDIAYWLPDDISGAFTAMDTRFSANGGVDFIIGWQGEADALQQRSQAAYNADLDDLANAMNTDITGNPKLVDVKFQRCPGIPDIDEDRINAAIQEACDDNPNVVACVDLTDITADDNYHPTSDAKLLTCGNRIGDALKTAAGL